MAKPKMRYFELSNGVKKEIDVDTLNTSKFGNYASTNYKSNVDTNLTLPVDPNEYTFLKTNPFLVTWNRTNQDYKSYSFDEFIIRYRNEDYRFGEFINSPKIRYGTKKSVVKKIFKKWDYEFKNKKNSSIEKVNSNLDVANDLYYEKKSFSSFLLIFFITIFMAICVFVPDIIFINLDTIFKTNIFSLISAKLLLIYNQYKLTLVVAIISLIFSVIYLISHIVYNYKCYAATKFINNHREWLKDNNNKISKKYSKNFKKVRNYYLKNINRKCRPFPPYKLKNIEMKTNVDVFEKLNVLTVDKIHYYKSTTSSGRKFTNMMFVFTILILLIYCLLVIYNTFCR